MAKGSRNRGKPKPKLRDLGRDHPSYEETKAVFEATRGAQPITAAILGAVLVELELERLLRYRLVRQSDEDWIDLTSDNGPLGTFHQKILMGRALRLYDDAVKHNLNIVRSIRNAFAQSKRLIDFEHELVIAELKSTGIPRTRKRAFREIKAIKYGGGQGSYLFLCHHLEMMIIKRHSAALKLANKRFWKRRKMPPLSSIASVFNALAEPLPGLLSPPQSSRRGQTFGPNPEAQLGPLGKLLAKQATSDGKKDR
jgi:hypothetical protein